MNGEQVVFAIFASQGQAESAVDELLANGFTAGSISVLCPKNKGTRELAIRKSTHIPYGTDHGRYANVPLNGTLGFTDPGEGPLLGALHDALIDLGVPAKWCDGRVVHGKHLLSVLCGTQDEVSRAGGILKLKGASDIACGAPSATY
jgi:hypothetical protein